MRKPNNMYQSVGLHKIVIIVLFMLKLLLATNSRYDITIRWIYKFAGIDRLTCMQQLPFGRCPSFLIKQLNITLHVVFEAKTHVRSVRYIGQILFCMCSTCVDYSIRHCCLKSLEPNEPFSYTFFKKNHVLHCTKKLCLCTQDCFQDAMLYKKHI